MSRTTRRVGGVLCGCLVVAMAMGHLAEAKGPKGHPARARAPRIPAHVRAAKPPAHKAPRMPRAAAPARARARPKATHPPRGTNTAAAAARAQHAAAARSNQAARANRAALAATSLGTNPFRSPYYYTYGAGRGARHYRAYGYGRGYRNRYYGNRYGYGRSQGYNRAIVGRLRSVHASLARLDHDYQGHRVRAMHAIAMAVRQLTHRSMVYRGLGFGTGGLGMGLGNGMGMGMGARGGAAAFNRNAGGRAAVGPRLSQAQSDARMGQALRTLQGIRMQMTGSSGTGFVAPGHGRAVGHVQRAIRELNIALAIR